MRRRTFKDRTLQACYDAVRLAASDNWSELYYTRSPNRMGPCFPHRGAGHRNAYWNGRTGVRNTYLRTSAAYAFWAAGQDDLRDHGPAGTRRWELSSTVQGNA